MSGNDEEIRVALTADPSDLAAGFEEAADVAEAQQQRMVDSAADAAAQMKATAVAVGESQAEAASRIKLMVQASLAAAAANDKQQVSERALMEAQGTRIEATEAQIAAAAAFRAAQEAQMVPMEAYIGATAAATVETEANTAATVENEAAQAGLNEKIASGAAVREYSALVDEALRGRYSQMTGTVATLSNRLGFMSALFSPMGAGIAATAGVVGIFTAALVKGTEEETKFEQAIQSTGNVLGMTKDQLHGMAENMAAGNVSINQANEALLAAANSGRTTSQNIQMVATAALNMAQVTGVSVKKAVEDFTSLEDKPLQAALKLNEQYHFLTAATYDQIAAFEKMGMTQQAAAVAQEAFAASFADRAAHMRDDESAIAKGWDDITTAISNAWAALKHNVSTNTLDDQIKAIDASITQLQQNMVNVSPSSAAGKWAEQQIQDLETQKEALQVLQNNQQGQAASQGASQQQTTDYIDYAQSEAKAQQHENKLTEIKASGLGARIEASHKETEQDINDLNTIEAIQTDRYQASVAADERALQQKLTLGEISKSQELAGMADLENQKYQLELADLNHQLELQNQETEAYNKLLLKKEQLLLQHQQKVGEIENQMVQAEVQRYQQMLAPINSAITTSINGIIQGTTTGKQALQRLGMSILDEFISTGVKMVTDWVATQAAQTTVSQAAAAKRAQVAAAAAAQDKAVMTAETSSNIASYAAVAGAAAASSVAAIPYYGWSMADEVGEATYSNVMAYQGMASAAGGWDRVPAETLTLLHPDEMVLSAPIATGARNMFKSAAEDQQGGSGAGRSSGDVHIHTMDANSFRDLLRRHPREFREGIAHAMKHS